MTQKHRMEECCALVMREWTAYCTPKRSKSLSEKLKLLRSIEFTPEGTCSVEDQHVLDSICKEFEVK